MEDSSKRLWSKFLRDAENSPDFSNALNKERQLFRELASRGELGENVTVMCCGDGREMDMLMELHREFPQLTELNGVDLLSISIEQVREKMREKTRGIAGVDVRLLHEDATATSIKPNSQDTVTCMLTMVNFDDKTVARFLKHVERILKPGGKFLFSVYNHKAFDARMDLYGKMGAPIESADSQSGLVEFGKDFEEASFSRQFAEGQIRHLVAEAGLEFSHYDDSGITHMGVLEKTKVHRAEKHALVCQQVLATAASIALIVGGMYVKMKKTEEIFAADKDAQIVEIGPGQFRIINWKTGKIY